MKLENKRISGTNIKYASLGEYRSSNGNNLAQGFLRLIHEHARPAPMSFRLYRAGNMERNILSTRLSPATEWMQKTRTHEDTLHVLLVDPDVLVLYAPSPSEGEVMIVPPYKKTEVHLDVRDVSRLRRAIRQGSPDTSFIHKIKVWHITRSR